MSRIFMVVALGLLWLPSVAFGVKFTESSYRDQVRVGDSWSLNLSKLLTNVAPDKSLTFEPTGLPPWLQFQQTKISGSPSGVQLGQIRFRVKVRQGNSSDEATMELLVYRAPGWADGQVDLGVQRAGKSFVLDLNTQVNNPSKIDLKFSATGLPQWMKVSSKGVVSGTPAQSDLGPYTGILFTLESSLGEKDSVLGFGEVKEPAAPPSWVADTLAGPGGVEDSLYQADLTKFIKNPDALAIRYTLGAKAPGWVNVTSSGKLFGIPRRGQVGPNAIPVELESVYGGKVVRDEATLEFQVVRVNKGPSFTKDPIVFPNAFTEKAVSESLLGYVQDPDLDFGDVLEFTLLSGPPWATVSPDGTLSGTPDLVDIGNNEWRVKVADALGLSAEATIRLEVFKTNHPPTVKPNIQFNLKERKTIVSDLVKEGYVVDSDGDPIQFEVLEGEQDWISLTDQGVATFKPRFNDIGRHSVKIRVSDGKLKTEGAFEILVIRDPRPPAWLQNPMTYTAEVGQVFQQDISGQAKDLDGLPVEFFKVDGPSWISLDAKGNLVGTPRKVNEGDNRVSVGVKNDKLQATATVIVRVEPGNQPPQWLEDPLNLPEVRPGQTLTRDLKRSVLDPEGDTLVFKMVMGPAWLSLKATGELQGTPTPSDIGQFAAIFEVTDGKVSAQAGAVGKVGSDNNPPVLKTMKFVVQAGKVLDENLNSPTYVEDPDGDTLTFKFPKPPAWAQVSDKGRLVANPQTTELGSHSIAVHVSDGTDKVTGTVQIEVTTDPRPPFFVEDPLKYAVKVGQLLEADISGKAIDPDGKPLTFTLTSGPGWLSLSADGKMTGLPGQNNVGTNQFKVKASNGTLSTQGTLIVEVGQGQQTQKVALDTPVNGAPTEILWVVDNSQATDDFMQSVDEGIRTFVSNLNLSGIRHTSTVLSSREWAGEPVAGSGGYMVKWSDSAPAQEISQRVASVQSQEPRHSSVWALREFYEQAPSLISLYKNGYFTEGVPMEVFLVAGQGDGFQSLAKGTADSGKTASQLAGDFLRFHRRESQPFTVSALDLRCPSPFDPSQPGQNRPAYLTLALNTLGTYFHMNTACDDRVVTSFASFAYSVRFRSYVYGKRTIPLKGSPSGSIKVYLNHFQKIELKGNTGAASDQWHHDSSNNAIVMHWENVMTPINLGDELIFEY